MRSRWVTGMGRNASARCRLFCFPHAGGSASFFSPWYSRPPDHVEVCPVELPGRGARLAERPFDDIAPMVQELGEVLLSCLDRPYAFFGHSMGALIAYELTRHIADRSTSLPILICVSGNAAPHLPFHGATIHDLPDGAFVAELRHLGGTPDEVLNNSELLSLLLPALRSDFAVCERYRHHAGPPLRCPILALGGASDRFIPPQYIEAWSMHTVSSFSCRLMPGDHFYLTGKMDEVLQMVSEQLGQVATA